MRHLLHGAMLFATLLASLYGVSEALAEDAPPVQLEISPVGVEGTYFDVEMRPGETRQFSVQLSNFSTNPAEARTYAATVYTIYNGGMGASLDGEPLSGAALWLNYPAETFTLAAQEGILRPFTVSVPADTAPGEYIAGLAIQNATPIQSGGNFAMNQVLRQVIAVAITVPGPVAAGLTIGDISHTQVYDKSVLAFDLTNTGNVRIAPAGELLLTDPDGVESRHAIDMDVFYAGDATKVEVVFPYLLAEGNYTAVLTLADPRYELTTTSAPLGIAIPKLELPTTEAPATEVPASTGESAGGLVVVQQGDAGGVSPTMVVAIAAGAAAVVGGAVAIFLRRGSRRQAPRPVPAIIKVREVRNSRPAQVKKMTPPVMNLLDRGEAPMAGAQPSAATERGFTWSERVPKSLDGAVLGEEADDAVLHGRRR